MKNQNNYGSNNISKYPKNQYFFSLLITFSSINLIKEDITKLL